jgi:hypothetical protein
MGALSPARSLAYPSSECLLGLEIGGREAMPGKCTPFLESLTMQPTLLSQGVQSQSFGFVATTPNVYLSSRPRSFKLVRIGLKKRLPNYAVS